MARGPVVPAPSVDHRLVDLVAANPWARLGFESPYVLPADDAHTGGFLTHLLPAPWYGPALTARVLLLMRNPGYHAQFDEADMTDPSFLLLSRAQLTGLAPFPWLDSRWTGSGGQRYWAKLVRVLADEVGPATVSAAFAVVQWAPYHSTAWPRGRGPFPSQAFTADLVRFAIERGSYIVVGRAWEPWRAAVPELDAAHAAGMVLPPPYPALEPYLTPGMLGASAFDAVLAALSGGVAPPRS